MKYLSLTVAASALLLAPATANAQFFGGFDNSSVLGGLAGAGIGGAIGSNLAGSGNRDEGTAIGAVVGGLAGTAYGNSRSNFYGNPYAGSFNPGFSGNSLFGTAVGAGIGGAIGSNLAGSGVRQEGTAIGAVLGGLAGNALTSRSRYGNGGFGGNYAPAGFSGGKTRYGSNTQVLGGGFAAPSYGPGFQAPFLPAPQFGAGLPSYPMGGTSFMPGGYVNAGTFANTTTLSPPTLPAPMPVYKPSFSGVTYAAPNVTLASPSPRRISTRYASNPISISTGSTVTQDYIGTSGVSQPLMLRRAPKQHLVIKHEYNAPSTPSYSAPASNISTPSGQSIHAETVNINYGNNSQVGTTNSNNGSTLGGHRRGQNHGMTLNSFDNNWGTSGSVNTGSYNLGSTSVLGGYNSYSNAEPVYTSGYSSSYSNNIAIAPTVAPASDAGAGGRHLVTAGQSFQAPSAGEMAARCAGGAATCSSPFASSAKSHATAGGNYLVTAEKSFQAPSADEFYADCATSTFGCVGSYETNQSYNHSTGGSASKGYKASGYSFCGSDKVYNDDGALIVGASPVCR